MQKSGIIKSLKRLFVREGSGDSLIKINKKSWLSKLDYFKKKLGSKNIK